MDWKSLKVHYLFLPLSFYSIVWASGDRMLSSEVTWLVGTEALCLPFDTSSAATGPCLKGSNTREVPVSTQPSSKSAVTSSEMWCGPRKTPRSPNTSETWNTQMSRIRRFWREANSARFLALHLIDGACSLCDGCWAGPRGQWPGHRGGYWKRAQRRC